MINIKALAVVLLSVFVLFSPISTQAAGFPVDLVTSENGRLSTDLVEGVQRQLSKREDIRSLLSANTHHLRLELNTQPVFVNGGEAGITLSAVSVLMVRQHSSGRFIPFLLDSSSGFCDQAGLKICILSVMAQLDAAMTYAFDADRMIRSLSSSR